MERGGVPSRSGEEFHHRTGAVSPLSVVRGSRLTMLHGMARVHVDMGSTESTWWVIKTKRYKFDREWVVTVIRQELYIV